MKKMSIELTILISAIVGAFLDHAMELLVPLSNNFPILIIWAFIYVGVAIFFIWIFKKVFGNYPK